MTIVYIGKKVPKHLEEVVGSIHLGKGIWMFKCKIKEKKEKSRR